MTHSSLMSAIKRRLPLIAALFLTTTLIACGGGATAPTDNSDPVVQITSPSSSDTAEYQLTGVAMDNVQVTEVAYTLGGAEPQPLTMTGNTFSATLTMAAGPNRITVTATDVAGNEGSDSVTVDYVAEPAGVTSRDEVAARGDSIVISGSNLGAAGEVLLGDAVLITDSWTESEITLTIPEDAPGGPQTVTVRTPGGDSSFELFVGVSYGPGTLDDLAAEGHPAGTAVLLSAGDYTQVATEVELDNLSLYGQGEGVTTIDTGPLGNYLVLLADADQDIVIADLTLDTGATFITPDTPGPIATARPAKAALASMTAAQAAEKLLHSAAGLYGASGELNAQAGGSGSLTLRNLTVTGLAGGVGFATVDPDADVVYPGAIHVENLTAEMSNSLFGLYASGDVAVHSSELSSQGFAILSSRGSVELDETTISGRDNASIVFEDSLRIDGAKLEAHTDMILAPFQVLAGPGPGLNLHIPIEITDSIFRVHGDGNLQIAALAGESHVRGNEFTVDGYLTLITSGGSLLVHDNAFELGVSAGSSSDLYLEAVEFSSHIQFTDNSVTYLTAGSLILRNNFDFLIRDNDFVGAAAGTAITIDHGPNADMTADIRNNLFRDFEHALQITQTTAETLGLTLTGNRFEFEFDAAGTVATLENVIQAEIDVDDNYWNGEENVSLLNSYIVRTGGTDPSTMSITSVLTD